MKMASSEEVFMAGESVARDGITHSTQRERSRLDIIPWCSGLRIVITGGCGFLGLHLAHLLYQEATDVSITLMDIKPPLNNETMSFITGTINNGLPVHHYRGSVLIRSDLTSAFEGADVVIHCAAVNDTVMTTNLNHDIETINKRGTENVVLACKSQGVKVLIHVGSIFQSLYDGVLFQEDINEDTPLIRDRELIMSTFSTSKNEGERLVLDVNGYEGTLYTCSIRLPPLYGQYDKSLIPSGAYIANKLYGYFPQIGNRSIKMEVLYVENAAHGIICAIKKLNDTKTRTEVGGQYYYITDDTKDKFTNYSDFFNFYLKALGYRVNSNKYMRLPIKLVTFCLYLILTFLVFIMIFFDVREMAGLILKYHHQVKVLSVSHTFSRDKAKSVLNYEPVISFDLASKKSLNYYYNEYRYNSN